MKTKKSTIEWHEYPNKKDAPPDNRLLLTLDIAGDFGLMFWRDDADSFDDPNYGLANGIVAWAHLPDVGQEGEENG